MDQFHLKFLYCKFISLEYIIAMQASIYRRNYYLIRVNSDGKLLKDENRQREIYSQTARVINEMISHTKNLLFKINSLREELEAFDYENDQASDAEDIMQNFREFQKSIPLTFFSQYPLDNKMVGPFVMRLTKEMGYWRKFIPFLSSIVKDVDQIFEEQKKNQTENISLIYFMTVKKIINDGNEFFRKLKTKVTEISEKSQDQKEEKQPAIFLVPSFRISNNRENQKKLKDLMLQKMRQMISGIYKNMDIQTFEALDGYIIQQSAEDNVDHFVKRQLKRNKKVKKQVKAYKLSYKEFLEKKVRNEQRVKFNRKLSNAKLAFSLNKKSLQKNIGSNKSLSSKNVKVSLPTIKPHEKDIDIASHKKKKASNNKQNQHKQSQYSSEKAKLLLSKIKLNKADLKLKL